MRYELDWTLEEVGVSFNVCRERVRQIEAKAIRKLKHPDRSDILRQFISDEYIKTTEDARRKNLEAMRQIMKFDMEAYCHMTAQRSTLPKLKEPRPYGMPWTEFVKTNAPDVYKALVAHIERYADKYLRD